MDEAAAVVTASRRTMTFDPLLAFFAFGLLARLVGAELALPTGLHETVSLLLLLSIGLHGGVELAAHPLGGLWGPALAVVTLGIVLTMLAYPALRFLVKLPRPDAAAVAAHYGSVSVGTFAVATAALASRGVAVEPYMAVFVVLLEAPAIIVGVLLARGGRHGVRWRDVLREVLLGRSIALLAGGLAIGWFIGRDGLAPVAPLFFGGFKSILALFLLEMGLLCGARIGTLRQYGLRLVIFALLMPLLGAGLGGLAGLWSGLSVGGTAMLATLGASASYIAVPAAMRLAIPEANPTLSLSASLGITFPFNVTIGIPLYLELSRWLHRGVS